MSSLSHFSQSLDWVVSSSVSSLDLEITLSKTQRLSLTSFVFCGVVSRAHNAWNTIVDSVMLLAFWSLAKANVAKSLSPLSSVCRQIACLTAFKMCAEQMCRTVCDFISAHDFCPMQNLYEVRADVLFVESQHHTLY